MKIISASKARESKVFAATVLAQVEATERDAAWQATLASINARFPHGVMHQS
jgi:hypothetical protein